MKELSITEYAKLKGITRQAVWKTIKAGKLPQGVKEVKNFGSFYVLIINDKKLVA